jgi:mycothiol synthase
MDEVRVIATRTAIGSGAAAGGAASGPRGVTVGPVEQLVWRGYAAGDAEALAAHHNLLAEYAGGMAGASVDTMESYVSAWLREPAADSRLVFSADGTLVAAGLVSLMPGGSRVGLGGSVGTGRAYCGVHPRWRGRGLGRQLLTWQLARASAIHEAAAPNDRWEIHVGAPAGDEVAARLFHRFGLAPVRYWFEMTAATTAPPSAGPPEGLRVISYDEKYERSLHAAHMASFADHWGSQYREPARWAPVTVRSDVFAPELSRLAVAGAEVVGFVLAYRVTEPERLYIGQVGTTAPWRRRGVAGGLLAEVVGAAGKAGVTSVGLQVDADSPTGALGVYERVGFSVRSRVVTYAAELPRQVE